MVAPNSSNEYYKLKFALNFRDVVRKTENVIRFSNEKYIIIVII